MTSSLQLFSFVKVCPNLDQVKRLVNEGYDVRSDLLCLECAVNGGSVPIVDYLIRQGAMDFHGHAARIAKESGNPDMERLFMN